MCRYLILLLNISQLIDIWDTILKERESGYEHRAPQKRLVKAKEETNVLKQEPIADIELSGCLITVRKI